MLLSIKNKISGICLKQTNIPKPLGLVFARISAIEMWISSFKYLQFGALFCIYILLNCTLFTFKGTLQVHVAHTHTHTHKCVTSCSKIWGCSKTYEAGLIWLEAIPPVWMFVSELITLVSLCSQWKEAGIAGAWFISCWSRCLKWVRHLFLSLSSKVA